MTNSLVAETIAIFWVMCGVVGAAMLSRHNKAGAGCLLGGLLGPLGLIIAYRMSDKCPYCAELILAKARVCKHCGREDPRR